MYVPMNTVAATPAKPRRVPHGWPACLRRQPAMLAFKNNDIYMKNDEESDIYEEPRERHPKVLCKDPASKNMHHEEEFDDNNYRSIDETTV